MLPEWLDVKGYFVTFTKNKSEVTNLAYIEPDAVMYDLPEFYACVSPRTRQVVVFRP